MTELRRIDPDRRMARFYALSVMPTLFGEWSLVAEWGRIGQAGQTQRRDYPDESTARRALTDRIRCKLRRGYRMTSAPPSRAAALDARRHVSD